MEIAGNSYDDLLVSLQGMFQIKSKVEIIHILQELTEMFAKDLDRIMSDCDEGIPWQSVVEQLGKYWLQVSFCEELDDADHRSLFSFLSKWLPELADYGLDHHFYPAIQVLHMRYAT